MKMRLEKVVKRSFKVDEVPGVEIPAEFLASLSTVHLPKLTDKI